LVGAVVCRWDEANRHTTGNVAARINAILEIRSSGGGELIADLIISAL
jgi:hypothetical protein